MIIFDLEYILLWYMFEGGVLVIFGKCDQKSKSLIVILFCWVWCKEVRILGFLCPGWGFFMVEVLSKVQALDHSFPKDQAALF